jgi:hypothetical protein
VKRTLQSTKTAITNIRELKPISRAFFVLFIDLRCHGFFSFCISGFSVASHALINVKPPTLKLKSFCVYAQQTGRNGILRK